MKNIKIIIATHKKYEMPKDNMYIPIHVGKEGKEDLGYIGDNTKDNISAQMSEIMYDGLVTTNPVTGETIPKLAKSFSVNGKEYLVNLRHGLKWSDGKPITADDVVFTWQNIIFDGFGNTSTRDSVMIDGKPIRKQEEKYMQGKLQ